MINKFIRRYFCSKLIFKALICLILLMNFVIVHKFFPDKVKTFKHNLFNKYFNFIQINKLSKKLIGKNVFYFQDRTYLVSDTNEDLNIATHEKYYDGEKFLVSEDLPIGTIQSGVVIFSGVKDKFGSTVIIQGTDGFNIWYGNLNNINATLYTYMEKASLIGNCNGKYVYILIEKDGKYYSYDEYKDYKG